MTLSLYNVFSNITLVHKEIYKPKCFGAQTKCVADI